MILAHTPSTTARPSTQPSARTTVTSDSQAGTTVTSPAPVVASETPQQKQTSEYYDSTTITPSPLNPTSPNQPAGSTLGSPAPVSSISPNIQRAISMSSVGKHIHGQESPVMNETLSVINEHITDMSTPRHSILPTEKRVMNDSGSEYSSQIDPRLSYITGHETDEEEQNGLTEAEILEWVPARVAEYLEYVGVEKKHCEVFEEQEIS